MRGKLIVCDGSNGAGKSTILEHIKEHLKNKNIEFISTREPGGTEVGEKIREILLDKSYSNMCSTTELMLFAAARAQHIHEKILPALEKGIHVISDRFESATVSFQQYGRGLPSQIVDQLNDLALGDFRPDMTIVLDLDPVIGLERVRSRGEGLDRMEEVDIEFLERARQGYLEQSKDYPERFTVIDASQSLENVVEAALMTIDKQI
jgi:dTMP kinase